MKDQLSHFHKESKYNVETDKLNSKGKNIRNGACVRKISSLFGQERQSNSENKKK